MSKTRRDRARGKERQIAKRETDFYRQYSEDYYGGAPPNNVAEVKAEVEAIANQPDVAEKAAKSEPFSVQSPPTDDPGTGTTLTWWFPSRQKYTNLSKHGSDQRQHELRAFTLIAPMVLNAMSALIKKTQSLQWFIESGRNLAIKWQQFFNNVEKGHGWDYFVARLVRAYSESDRGAYAEIIRGAPSWAVGANNQLTKRGESAIERGKDRFWPIVDLAVLDPAQCTPTNSREWPMVFRNPYAGTIHKMRQYNFIHIMDMPDVDASKSNHGLCAVSRAVWAATEDNMITRYSMEKMSDNPGSGLVVANIAPNVLRSALTKVAAQRQARGIVYYKGLTFLPILDPSGRFAMEVLNFSELMDGFDRLEMYNITKEIVAAAFGMDPLELGSLPGNQLGSAKQSSVLSDKARSKGLGAIVIAITRELRHKVLPPSVQFRFQAQDIAEELGRAEVDQIYFRNAMLMAKSEVWDAETVNSYLAFKEAIPRSLVEGQTTNIELADVELAKSWRHGDLIRIDSEGVIETLAYVPYVYRDRYMASNLLMSSKAELIVPVGASLPLPPIPLGASTITESDIDIAIANRDQRDLDLAGILDAVAV